ncbi:protease, partial [mine drainage metagenome]
EEVESAARRRTARLLVRGREHRDRLRRLRSDLPGPRARFWQRMTKTGLILGSAALVGDRSLRSQRLEPADLALGGAIAAGLYGVFTVGDKAARVVMPQGAQDIGNIYQLRQLRPAPELALRLALVVAPAEELFWRGLVQGELSRRFGPARGAVLATALYGGAHLCTGNA